MRKTYLDITRILAFFLVIVNHTNSRIFLSLQPSATWFASLSYFFVSKIAVPLFLLVSGELLLGREDGYKKCAGRFLRIFCALIVFSLFYYIRDCAISGSAFSLPDFALTIYRRNITNAFWYLYLYLGIAAMLPLLQKLFSKFERRDYMYFCAVSLLVLGTVPYLKHFIPALSESTAFHLPLFSAYLGLMAAGRYFGSVNPPDKKAAVTAAVLFVLCIAANIAGTYREYLSGEAWYLFFDNRIYSLLTVPAVCAFVIIRYVFGNAEISEKAAHILRYVSSLTFGGYLLCDMAIDFSGGVFTSLSAYMHPLAAMVLWEGGLFIVCLAAAALLLKIPLVRKML